MNATLDPTRPPIRTDILSAAALLMLAACGAPKDASTTDGETETTAGTDAWSSDGSSTGGPGTCRLPPDEVPAPDAATQIVVRNDTNEVQYLLPILLGCNSELVGLAVEGFGSDLPFSHLPPASCRDDAGEVAPESFCAFGCSDGSYPGLALAPGAQTEIPWDGTVWIWTNLPASGCNAEELCADVPGGDGAECRAARAIPAGTPVTLRAEVTSTCPTPETPEACTCDAGTCPISVYDLTAPEPERIISADGIVGQSAEIVIPP